MSTLLFVGWLLMLLKTTEHKFLVWTILIFIIAFTIHVGFISENFELLFSRFEEKGIESSNRTNAWSQYIDYSLSGFINFLFGTKTHQVPLVRDLDDSIHNSYLTAHAYLGILCVYYLYLAFKGYWSFIKQKHFFLIAFFGAFLIKAIVDADFPCTAVGGDIYICILILTGLNK